MKKILAISLLGVVLSMAMAGVASAQVIGSIFPRNVSPGQSVAVTVRGSDFSGGCDADITSGGTSGITITPCAIANTGPNSVASFTVSAAAGTAQGSRTLTVIVGTVSQEFPFNIGGIAAPERTIPTGITTAQGFIEAMRTLTDWLFVILVIVSVVFIVLAGLQFITGGGDPAAISAARTKLIWAAVGVGVALLARGLPAAIENLIGA